MLYLFRHRGRGIALFSFMSLVPVQWRWHTIFPCHDLLDCTSLARHYLTEYSPVKVFGILNGFMIVVCDDTHLPGSNHATICSL